MLRKFLGLVCPRLAMICLWIFTTYVTTGFKTWFMPVLGIIFLPITTLTYLAAMINNNHEITGWWAILLVAAIIVDFAVNLPETMEIMKEMEKKN